MEQLASAKVLLPARARQRVAIAALVATLAFLPRFLWLAYSEPIPVSDFLGHLDLAAGLLAHGQLGYPEPSAYRLPVYPAFLAAVMLVSRSVFWLSLVNVLLSTALVYPVYLLALWCTSNRRISLVAAVLCAVNPTFIFFSPLLASEQLFVLLLLSSFLALSAPGLNRPWGGLGWAALAGVLAGTAALTRGEGLFYLPVLALVGFVVGKTPKQKCTVPLIIVLSAVATLSPWYLRNRHLLGEGAGLSTTGGINFYYAHNSYRYGCHSLEGTPLEGLSETEVQKVGYSLGMEFLSAGGPAQIVKDVAKGTVSLYLTPGTYSVRWSIKTPREVSPQVDPPKPKPSPWINKPLRGVFGFKLMTLFYYLLLVAACPSVWFLGKYPLRATVIPLGLFVMNWTCYAAIFWAKARYRYTIEVILCILCAVSLYHLVPLVRRRRAPAREDAPMAEPPLVARPERGGAPPAPR